MSLTTRAVAEFFGTFWLVFGGCGSALFAAAYPQLGIGFAGVALAFGLTVLTMAFAIGHISGAHLNPAVSIGLYTGGRFDARAIFSPTSLPRSSAPSPPLAASTSSPAARRASPAPPALPPTATPITHPPAIPCSPASSRSSCSPHSSSSSSSDPLTSAPPKASRPSPSASASRSSISSLSR
jgi:Major intrinsic protein